MLDAGRLWIGSLGSGSGKVATAGRLITPDELRRITEQKDVERMREALEEKRKIDEERHHLYDTFLHQEVPPDALQRAPALVRGAAERGEREVLPLRFPSEYCTDAGRAINSFAQDWPDALTGFARPAYEFWYDQLEPQGYRLRAQIIDFPESMPGDVGILLRW